MYTILKTGDCDDHSSFIAIYKVYLNVGKCIKSYAYKFYSILLRISY